MREALPVNSTSIIRHVFAMDSAASDGSGKTGLAFGDITAYYVRAGGTLTAMTLETIATLGTWASSGDNYLGFKLMHDTNAPGLYEIHLPNNLFAAGSDCNTLLLRASGMAPLPVGIPMLEAILEGVVDETAFTATATEFESETSIAEATPDHFIGRVIVFVRRGDLALQATKINDYALSGSRGHFTVDSLTDLPDTGDRFRIY